MTLPTDDAQTAAAALEATINDALNQHSRGNLQQAEKQYRTVLVKDPKHAVALHYLGVIALQTNNADQAIKLISESIMQAPDYADAYSNLANAYQAKGRFKDAAKSLEKTLQLTDATASPNPEIQANLGNAYAQLSNFQSAAENYQRAIAIGRKQGRELPEVHRNLANAWLQLGRPGKALNSITEANLSLIHI